VLPHLTMSCVVSFADTANGSYANFPGRMNEQTTSVPLTIENPMYRNYR